MATGQVADSQWLYLVVGPCASNTVRGKILEGENFGKFGEWQAIHQNFPCQYL